MPKASFARKRKSQLEKTNGGVEPWGEKGMKQQSLLSFANLQDESDEDKGPIVKESDSVEFLLQKDASVQKIKMEDHLAVRSSRGTTRKDGDSSALLLK